MLNIRLKPIFDDDDYWIGLQNAAHFLKCSKVTKNKNLSLFPNVKFIYQITYFGILLNQLNALDKIESSSKLQKVVVEKKALNLSHEFSRWKKDKKSKFHFPD